MKKRKNVNSKTLFITRAAVIAALYVVLTLVSALFGLAGIEAAQALADLIAFIVSMAIGIDVLRKMK
jgi:uncharacterized membrane protein